MSDNTTPLSSFWLGVMFFVGVVIIIAIGSALGMAIGEQIMRG